jgi:15-cis-phytoene synthase
MLGWIRRKLDASDHCEVLVRDADKDRYLATLFAPERHRRPLYALYAFNNEIARVRDHIREPMPGEIRLQWWRDVLGGKNPGDAGAAPVAAAIRETIVRYRLPLDALNGIIEARAFDLYNDPVGTLGELEAYGAKTSSSVMALAAQILNDGNDAGVEALARHAGIALAITGLLDAFALHSRRRQLYLPLDLLQRHGARADEIFAGVATSELRAALAAMRRLALSHLSQARPLIGIMPVGAAPAVLPAALIRPSLDRMERSDYDPFVLNPLPQWRRQWLLFRAARNPRRIAE